MSNEGILLESGTNEVEVLEFELGGQSFGVNVLKIQAIELYDPKRVTHIQLSHPSVVGTLLFRDSCITLVDLTKEMDAEIQPPEQAPEVETAENDISEAVEQVVDEETDLNEYTEEDLAFAAEAQDNAAEQKKAKIAAEYAAAQKLVLVMEFNNLKTAFLVDGVNRIHRVSWENINPLSPFLATTDSKFTGSLNINEQEILLVDMEKVVTEILPAGQSLFGVSADTDNPQFEARSTVTVFLAEDSGVIRETVRDELAKGNYVDVHCFANGRDCLDKIEEVGRQSEAAGKPVTDILQAVISDIEMPALDGLTLCRTVKENPQLRNLPVIMFSSLINEQITAKCEAVQANACITKPQFAELVALLDKYCLEPAGTPA